MLDKKINYIIATMGILISILVGTIGKTWSTPRIVVLAILILGAAISAVIAVRKTLNEK
ncbi:MULTISPECIES: hypothetical protein [Lactobacillus]|uniref:hypothetical protein n=1 Tax=Lactobacillus TaxID=1578 RepID=UPI0013747E46|nr:MULTISPECIES: hypothetical protein [Lactobacillus]